MYRDDILKDVTRDLKIRFPIAQLAKDLGYSKGVVSMYFNNKKPLSDSFVESFENFYKIKLDDYNEGKSYKEYKKESETVKVGLTTNEEVIVQEVVKRIMERLQPFYEIAMHHSIKLDEVKESIKKIKKGN